MYEPVPQKSRYLDNYNISDHFYSMQVTGLSELRLATDRYPQPQVWVLCGDFVTIFQHAILNAKLIACIDVAIVVKDIIVIFRKKNYFDFNPF